MTTYVQDRVPFQETPIEVVRAQAEQLDLPLIEIELPEIFPKNSIYQSLIVEHIAQYSTQIDVVAFGDIYCNGIAEYRRSYLEPVGYQCFFPLLGQSPQDLARLVINHGIEAKIITVDTEQLSGEFVGRDYTLSLVNSLPDGVDPCGENGEFHTLVVNMPQFKRPLLIDYQDIDRRGRFHYQTYRLA
jgi:diphthamide synthase (EF-2-diphthine--ammonia ligase)